MVSTNSDSICGCKGIRFCALCETSDRAAKLKRDKRDFLPYKTYLYVDGKNKRAVEIRPTDSDVPCSMEILFAIHQSKNIPDVEIQKGNDSVQNENSLVKMENEFGEKEWITCDDITLIPEFISEEEERELVEKIDRQPWLLSQSGRRKQDYGPRVNFKHRKVKLDQFAGMPLYSRPLIERMATNSLSNYVPLELCNLEYDPDRRSCIDFHIDDTWIWGNRLISINLLGASVMTMIDEKENRILYVPMPRRSLLCMAGRMRYEWKHGVLPEHILSRRIALTMREPSSEFLPGGGSFEKWGKALIDRCNHLIDV